MRHLLLALTFSAAVSTARAEVIPTASWGCRDLETVERMNEAIIAGDRWAAEAILGSSDSVWGPGCVIR